MNKKFGNKYYTLFTDNYIEKKSLFKTSKVFYSDIVKIYITVPMYDNKKKNIKKNIIIVLKLYQRIIKKFILRYIQ